jgi:hypothetical protein
LGWGRSGWTVNLTRTRLTASAAFTRGKSLRFLNIIIDVLSRLLVPKGVVKLQLKAGAESPEADRD